MTIIVSLTLLLLISQDAFSDNKTCDGNILLFGGFDLPYKPNFDDVDFWSDRDLNAQVTIMDKCGDNKKALVTLPHPACLSVFGLLNRQVIVCGGNAQVTDSCWKLSHDGTEWTKFADMINARVGASALVLNDLFWVTGGRSNYGKGMLKSSELIKANGKVSRGPDLPQALFGHATIRSNDQIMVIGGGFSGDKRQKIYVSNTRLYNLDLEFQGEGPALNVARMLHGSCSIQSSNHNGRNIIVVAGGSALESIEIWDHSKPDSKWQEISNLPIHMTNPMLHPDGDGIIIVSDNVAYKLFIGNGHYIYKELDYQLLYPRIGFTSMMIPNDVAVNWKKSKIIPTPGSIYAEKRSWFNSYKSLAATVPYQVSVRNYMKKHICGGAILDAATVLTAAHCFGEFNSARMLPHYVLAGEEYREAESDTEFEVDTVIHYGKKFGRRYQFQHDIVLLKLKSPMKLTDGQIEPIQLPSSSLEPNENMDCYISGWATPIFYYTNHHGYPSGPAFLNMDNFEHRSSPYNSMRLLKAKVPLTSCKHGYDSEHSPFPFSGTSLLKNSICTEHTFYHYPTWCSSPFNTYECSTCVSDSGGPLVCEINGVSTLIGSFTICPPEYCGPEMPSLFTKIMPYVDWIKSHLT